MPARVLALALCVVLLLAGCGGVGSPPTDAPGNATAAPVPADTPVETLPPGLSREGITNASRLAAAHAAALADASFTVRSVETVTAANGSRLMNVTRHHRVAATGSPWRGTTTYANPLRAFGTRVTTVEGWSDGTTIRYRADGPDGTRYESYSRFERQWTGRIVLSILYGRSADVAVTVEDGSIRLAGRLSEVVGMGRQSLQVQTADGRFEATLTPAGRVKRLRVRYDGRLTGAPNATVEGRYRLAFSAVGETAVDAPGWVATARNRTPSD